MESVGAIAQTSTSLTGGTTSTVTARVRIDAPDGSLLIDYECDVDVRLGSASGVVLVPVESVRTDNTGSYCYVVENGALRRTAVKRGILRKPDRGGFRSGGGRGTGGESLRRPDRWDGGSSHRGIGAGE